MTEETHSKNISYQPWLRRGVAPGLLFAALLLAVAVGNPFRDMVSQDDSWAYAWSVQHLLTTGKYQLDDWAAANMPVQIYLAAGLSHLAGYSLTLLRCTTFALLVVAIFSFYALLREISCTRRIACVLTLALLASPLLLMLGFTFMSDIQFLGWLLLALWLYVRGIRHQSAKDMFLGSLAAGCAIGTRQFGVALLGGLILSWLLSRREDRPPVRLMLLGLLVPILAAVAQFHMGLTTPNVTQAYRLAEQHRFLSHPIPMLLKEGYWRFSIILQYIGMGVFPVLPLFLAARQSPGKQPAGSRLLIPGITILACVAIVAALSMSSFLTARPEAQHQGVWEPLELYWVLPNRLKAAPSLMRIFDLSGIAGAAAVVWTGLRGIQRLRASRRFSSETIFLAGTCAGLLALHMIYVQLNDTYIAALIPFGLLVVAGELKDYKIPKATLGISAALSITLILLVGLCIRGEYSRQFAACKAADTLVEAGIQPANIEAPLAWAEYHRAFDDWVAAGTPGLNTPPKNTPRGYDAFHDPFYSWLDRRGEQADYRIAYSLQDVPPNEWQIIATRSYRNIHFKRNFIWTLKRTPSH